MAETTTNKARRVCEKMGLKYPIGNNSYYIARLRRYVDCANLTDQHALAMMCVAEGVDVVKAPKNGYWVGEHYKIYCKNHDQLIRTIYDVYLEG